MGEILYCGQLLDVYSDYSQVLSALGQATVGADECQLSVVCSPLLERYGA
jgi:hypothetical protein